MFLDTEQTGLVQPATVVQLRYQSLVLEDCCPPSGDLPRLSEDLTENSILLIHFKTLAVDLSEKLTDPEDKQNGPRSLFLILRPMPSKNSNDKWEVELRIASATIVMPRKMP